MRVIALAALVSVTSCCVTLGAPGLKEIRKPVDPPEGEWWVEKWEVDGEVCRSSKDVEIERQRWSVTLTKNKMVVIAGGGPVSNGRRVEYYQNGTVLEFDLSPDLRVAEPKTLQKGIWKVDGDILLLCYAEQGGDRPTDFTAPKDSGRTLWTLKRKPKK